MAKGEKELDSDSVVATGCLVVAKWGLGSGLVVAKGGLVVTKGCLVVSW